jgi:hypothetical protein
MSESTLTPRKKQNPYCTVTSPPELWFEAVFATAPEYATPLNNGESHGKAIILIGHCRVIAVTRFRGGFQNRKSPIWAAGAFPK